MLIESVETYIVEQQLEKPFYFSQWEYASRRVCLVKVIAKDGSYGWGEGYGPAGVVSAGIDFLAPLVIGEDPLHVETIWQKMYRRSFDYARSGVLVASLSALDIALWDLRGKLIGQPVSTLLGGRRRDKVKVYATGLYFTKDMNFPDDLAVEATDVCCSGLSSDQNESWTGNKYRSGSSYGRSRGDWPGYRIDG